MRRNKDYIIKELDVDNYSFKGYLSTYGNADRVGDVIEKGAFDKSVEQRKTVPMLYNHERNSVIGKMTIESNDKGLYVDAQLCEGIEEAEKVYKLLKMGALSDMSVGMNILDFKAINEKDPFGAWNIKEAEVLEGSVVTIPANPQAKIEDVKDLYGNEDKYKKLLINLIKKL